MNASESRSKIEVADAAEESRRAVLHRFKVEDIQHLGQDKLLAAQSLAGHGSVWGRWQTPKSISPGALHRGERDIDLALRLRDYLAKEHPATLAVDRLVEEGVLMLTRLCLLMRLVPSSGGGHGKVQRLKPSSIARYVYTYWPQIAARAIRRKADDPATVGFFQLLTEADLLEFTASKLTRVQLERLDTLVVRGVWSDAPPLPCIRQTTNPQKNRASPPAQKSPEPYLSLPDKWLAEIGPRVLWLVQEMGPHLLHLLEQLPEQLKDVDWSRTKGAVGGRVRRRMQGLMNRHPWLDRAGKPLLPTFRLITSAGKHGSDILEWPPRNWEQLITLSVTLQAAHLFIALLGSAGRVGEITSLARHCVEIGRDGKNYLRGYTYKVSGNLFGDDRPWPAPEVLCQALGQQARLAAAMDWLPRTFEEGLPQTPRFGNALWLSLGVAGTTGERAELNINQTLTIFARRLDMDTKPGGDNLHAHRFRKTMGRLAGVALFNSPLVLKRLFGHKSIEMTLHYILCDPGVREEAEKVLRELRIMHCAEALEEIHEAMRTGQPLPGNGGPGAGLLVTAVRSEAVHLEHSGRTWDDGSAYELAYVLTAQGQGWRLVKENIVCSKAPGEDGLCQKKRPKGEPDTANCQPECGNRIVLMRRRRDTELVIEQYLYIARQARDDGQILVLAAVMENLVDELENFSDLKGKYLASPEVQSLLALCEEPDASDRAA